MTPAEIKKVLRGLSEQDIENLAAGTINANVLSKTVFVNLVARLHLRMSDRAWLQSFPTGVSPLLVDELNKMLQAAREREAQK